ncbi:hypothetical protein AKJ16_DCAP22246 [Drosera capensis]
MPISSPISDTVETRFLNQASHHRLRHQRYSHEPLLHVRFVGVVSICESLVHGETNRSGVVFMIKSWFCSIIKIILATEAV